MADVIKSFVSTRRTCMERRLDATKSPTQANQLALAKAVFALSLARIRLLRQYDTHHGHLFMNAKREVVSAREALIACANYDPCVEQMSLEL